jgi:outer membrane receptor for monomeric catechols
VIAALDVVDAEADHHVLEERGVLVVGLVIRRDIEDELVAARHEIGIQQRGDAPVGIGLGLGQQTRAAIGREVEQRDREPDDGLPGLEIQDMGADVRSLGCQVEGPPLR